MFPAYSEEQKKISNDHEFNFYTGMFDFSDDGKRAGLFGIQHQNESLTRDSFLGTISPVTGIMLTADSASYFYTGIQVLVMKGMTFEADFNKLEIKLTGGF